MNRRHFYDLSEDEWLELRLNDVTSTEVSCLFGENKYKSYLQLWNEKKTGCRPVFKENERTIWGNRLEHAVAMGMADDIGVTATPKKEYIRIEELRLGASFDYETSDDGILEIKTVADDIFRSEWFKMPDGDYIAPPHIEMQVQCQMMVSGIEHAYLGVLVGGNSAKILTRKKDQEVFDGISEAVSLFWESVDSNRPPEADFSNPMDVSAVINCYKHAEPRKVMSATTEIDRLAKRYSMLGAVSKRCDKKRDAIKAQILTMITDAEKVYGDGYTISAGVIGPSSYQVNRDGYRSFKITTRRGKK
jgi:putative phage-type endonuclease